MPQQQRTAESLWRRTGRTAAGYDRAAYRTENSNLCFLSLEPKLESGLNIIWKKYQVFSSAAELFLNRMREQFSEIK